MAGLNISIIKQRLLGNAKVAQMMEIQNVRLSPAHKKKAYKTAGAVPILHATN